MNPNVILRRVAEVVITFVARDLPILAFHVTVRALAPQNPFHPTSVSGYTHWPHQAIWQRLRKILRDIHRQYGIYDLLIDCLYSSVASFALIQARQGLAITAHHGETTKAAQGTTSSRAIADPREFREGIESLS
jgi:hypothetical protein